MFLSCFDQYHGGTNFGRTAGGPFIATSYDYDAPLDEYGKYKGLETPGPCFRSSYFFRPSMYKFEINYGGADLDIIVFLKS